MEKNAEYLESNDIIEWILNDDYLYTWALSDGLQANEISAGEKSDKLIKWIEKNENPIILYLKTKITPDEPTVASLDKQAEEGYQGWKNYSTWAIALWIDNEQGLQEEVKQMVKELNFEQSDIAESIKDIVEEMNPLKDEPSMFADLLQSAIDDADFYEIAEHFIKGEKEEDEYQKNKIQE